MGYRLDLTGRQVEEILNNALLKVEQPLTEQQKVQVQINLGFITEKELKEAVTPLASKKETEAIGESVDKISRQLSETGLKVDSIEVKIKEIDELKASKEYVTEEQWEYMEQNGLVKDDVEYNIFEEQ